MLPVFILGLALMVGLVLVTRWVSQADPRLLLRLIGWTLGGVMVSVFVFLAVTGRLAWALAALVALLPWLARLAGRTALSTFLRGVLRSAASGGASGGGGAAAGGFGPVGGGHGWRHQGWGRADDRSGRSEVTTRFLRMTLDHATGTMDGLVLDGASAGQALADLGQAALAALWRETGADPDSRRVLEAWLDRAQPDWRTNIGDDEPDGPDKASAPPPPGSGSMDRAEALAVLGLDEGADTEAIQTAWRRLMQAVHPDRGGSPYLAARLNQARDLLLGASGRRSR